jgi:hypothetical protein
MDHSAIALDSQFSEDLRKQRLRAVELLQRCTGFSEVAGKMGTTEAELRRLLDKHNEIETAKSFLETTKLLDADILTLKEFVGIDTCPSTNRDLDYVCPDVVAITNGWAVGIELTAYGGDESENRLFDIRCEVSQEAREEFGDAFDALLGFRISCDPVEGNVLRKAQVRAFTKQLLQFVLEKTRKSPFSPGERIVYPPYWTLARESSFKDWDLLHAHIRRIRVHAPNSAEKLSVAVSMSSPVSCRGTSVELLIERIRDKIKSLEKAYRKNIDQMWLLIHATRNPISSDIYPLFPQEIERLLGSEAGFLAKQSEYERVILWDKVDGGHVDLKSGEFIPTEI